MTDTESIARFGCVDDGFDRGAEEGIKYWNKEKRLKFTSGTTGQSYNAIGKSRNVNSLSRSGLAHRKKQKR